MSNKSLLEYEIDFDTLIELANQDMSKSKYKMYLEYITDTVDDAMCELEDEEDGDFEDD